jgi:hypothetical protein
MLNRQDLCLDDIQQDLREKARESFERGEVEKLLWYTSNEYGLDLIRKNIGALRDRGLYERALLHAYIGTRTNYRHWSPTVLRFLFELADRGRLLQCGDTLPGLGPFTVYRGVSGRGRARRVRGISWTDSIERARWFAGRFAPLRDPAVFRTVVSACDVLAYTNARNEGEFLILLPASNKPTRVLSIPPNTAQPF